MSWFDDNAPPQGPKPPIGSDPNAMADVGAQLGFSGPYRTTQGTPPAMDPGTRYLGGSPTFNEASATGTYPDPSQRPTAPAPSGAGGGGDPLALIRQYQSENPNGNLQGMIAFLNAHGVKATAATHAGGTQPSDDKIVLPDGTYYDVRNDQGWQAPGAPSHWDPNVPVVDPSGNFTKFGDYLSSQGLPVPAFNPSPEEMGGGSPFGQTGGAGGAGYNGPGGFGGLTAPFTGQFQSPGDFSAPDLNNTNDPGYAARLKMGTDAIQKSAAGKGTLLTGGTLKDLMQYGQDFASNEYDKVFNRALTTNNTAYQRALGEFGLGYDIFRNNQNDAFSKLFGVTGLGLNAAGGANSALSGYGAGLGGAAGSYGNLAAIYGRTNPNLTDLYTGIGNVNAGAQLAGGQINANLIGNLGNIAGGALATLPPRTPNPPPTGPTGSVGGVYPF